MGGGGFLGANYFPKEYISRGNLFPPEYKEHKLYVSHILMPRRVRNTSYFVAHTDTLQVSDESVDFSSQSSALTAIFIKASFFKSKKRGL